MNNPSGSQIGWIHKFNSQPEIFKKSLQTGILTPYTSFIALENEDQKKALLKKQKEQLAKQIRNQNNGEEIISMSEPDDWIWLVFILIFISWLIFKKKLIGDKK